MRAFTKSLEGVILSVARVAHSHVLILGKVSIPGKELRDRPDWLGPGRLGFSGFRMKFKAGNAPIKPRNLPFRAVFTSTPRSMI